MTPLQATGYIAQALAALSAVVVARRRPEYRPAAIALTVLAAANILDGPTAAALDPPPVGPWQGPARLLVCLEGALNLAGYAAMAGLAVALAVSPARRRAATAAVVGTWLLASIVLAAFYPSPLVRGDGLQRIYFGADLIALFVSTVALITKARARIAVRESPDGAYLVALGLVLLDAAILLAPFSPWRADLFGSPYGGVQVALTLFFGVITTAQVTTWSIISRG